METQHDLQHHSTKQHLTSALQLPMHAATPRALPLTGQPVHFLAVQSVHRSSDVHWGSYGWLMSHRFCWQWAGSWGKGRVTCLESLPEKQNMKIPAETGTPDQLTNGGCWCVKPVTVAPSQPTRASRATEAKMPPTDRNDSRDRSRSHTVGNTSSAANSINVCRTAQHRTRHREQSTVSGQHTRLSLSHDCYSSSMTATRSSTQVTMLHTSTGNVLQHMICCCSAAAKVRTCFAVRWNAPIDSCASGNTAERLSASNIMKSTQQLNSSIYSSTETPMRPARPNAAWPMSGYVLILLLLFIQAAR